MNPEYQYTVADESELDQLLSGHEVMTSTPWNRWSRPSRPHPGSVGVVWARGDSPNETANPLVLISNEEDIRRLCGRYAQLHSDLSPLTAWCHLLTPEFLEPLDSLVKKPNPEGMQAAWTGLIVAEAVLLAERPVASIRISACLATQSFAVARTSALWSHVPVEDIAKRFDKANRICRSDGVAQREGSRIEKLRSSLLPLWHTLISLSQGREAARLRELEPIIAALEALRRARSYNDKQEARHLVLPLIEFAPEADSFNQLGDLEPEMRLRLFDKLVDHLDESTSERTTMRHNALALLAGYLATVAAGGAPSLSLAESSAARWPEITAWAYLIGGIGENVVWTSSFDGLGRLVARELLRPLRLDESPTCDFAFDEANVLADSKLRDPLVHLRIKQARLVTVALLPGVNISIPIAETASQIASNADVNRSNRPPSVDFKPDPMSVFVDALWPHLQKRIDDYVGSGRNWEGTSDDTEEGKRNRDRRKLRSQTQLPIGNPKKYRP